jgi:hypothetical protein
MPMDFLFFGVFELPLFFIGLVGILFKNKGFEVYFIQLFILGFYLIDLDCLKIKYLS